MSATEGRECPPGAHSMFDFCPGDCTKPVTAWEILWDAGVSEDIIDGALHVHAHELAEKIREDLEVTGDWTCCAEARGASANLIDPEVG